MTDVLIGDDSRLATYRSDARKLEQRAQKNRPIQLLVFPREQDPNEISP
jgi:hypothetical protein